MERITINTQYLSGHHSILGPSRFLPYESRGYRAPLFNFGGGWGGHFGHGPIFGGGMYEQNIIIDNGRSGFWGNLADGLEGFVRGFTNVSWLMNGGMQPMVNPMMMQQPMMMQPMMMQQPGAEASQETETDKTANQEYTNLKNIASTKGYSILKDIDGTYTAYTKTGEHISGDYATVKDELIKAEKVETEKETNTEKKTQKAEADDSEGA